MSSTSSQELAASASGSNEPECEPSRSVKSSVLLGVDDGFSDWVDRRAALGNAVVPQIPEIIGRAIMSYDSWKARSPDDDLGDPSMYEKPDPAQELADWEYEKVDGSYFTECNYPKCGCARFGRCENRGWVDAAALQAAHEIVALPESWNYTRKKAAIQTIVAREMTRAMTVADMTKDRT